MSGSNSSARAAGPAAPEPVALTVHSLAAPRLDEAGTDGPRQRRIGRLKMLLVLLACASPVIASYFTYFVIRPEGRTNYGTLIQPTRAMPALELRDLDGQPVVARTLRGQWLLLVVGPAACDATCEQLLFTQRQLREMVGREKDRIDKLWLITDDAPLRPELRGALLQPGADVQVLRVAPGALAAWLEPAPGHALPEHLYIVDPMGEWMMRMPAQAEPQRVKRDLDRLLRASGSWDQPGR
jgi:hypothetical protein